MRALKTFRHLDGLLRYFLLLAGLFVLLVALFPRWIFPSDDTSQPFTCAPSCSAQYPPAVVASVLPFTDVYVLANGLDPSAHSLTVHIFVGFTSAAWDSMVDDTSTPAHVCLCHGTRPALNPMDVDDNLVVTVTTVTSLPQGGAPAHALAALLQDGTPLSSARVNVGLLDIFRSWAADPTSGTAFANTTVNLPIAGNPKSYPQDDYTVALTVAVTSAAIPVLPPTHVYLQADNSNADFMSTLSDANGTASFEYKRPPSTVFFADALTYGVPGTLLIYFLIVMYGPNAEEQTLRDFLVALAILSVSLLLLHQVLVPSSITVLTRIDYSLMASVVLMLLLPLPRVVRILTRRPARARQGRAMHNNRVEPGHADAVLGDDAEAREQTRHHA